MTAPDQPVCGRGSCTPDCGMGQCALELAHTGSEQANEQAPTVPPKDPQSSDLRELFADAIRAADSWAQVGRPDDRERFADACAAVVQPELDRLREDLEIEQLTTRQLCKLMHHHKQRADAAEADLADLRRRTGHLTEQHQQIGDQQ